MSKKYILKSDYLYAQECINHIFDLHDEFKRVYKRSSKIDLNYSLGGKPGAEPLFELVARFDPADEAELDFFKLEVE